MVRLPKSPLKVPLLTVSLLTGSCLALVAAGLGPRTAEGAVKVHGLFTNNTVLQRGVKLPVWGTTDKLDKVTIKLAGQERSAEPDDGQWRVEFDPLAVGEPLTMTISQGDAKHELINLIVGDVWVCGGQSNMEWPVSKTAGGSETVAAATNDKIRLFTVPRRGNTTPETEVGGEWFPSNPQSVANFSAVGYYFGRDLEQALHVPIGLINSNIGGTTGERWLSKEAIEAAPEIAHLTKPQPAGGAPQGTADLWNAMIAPLTKFPIRGAIWYQGEGNAGRAWQYRTLLPTLIRSWRDAWHQGDFPFLIVQLAPFQAIQKEPSESEWAELRDAQLFVSQSVPKTGLAVITDLGDEKDIHPQRKKEVGQRLALAARAIAYDEQLAWSGPLYQAIAIDGDRAILSFQQFGNGLEARGGELQGFTIAGEDKKFYNATAKIDGDKVVVHSDKVSQPQAVRYGWANFPLGNLWSRAGLPASPFRTDEYPYVTVNRK